MKNNSNVFMAMIILSIVNPAASANEAQDQLERAGLLREFLEPDQTPEPAAPGSSLPGASIEGSEAGTKRRQFEEAEWRKLLGSQQTQIHAPSTHAIPQSQWRLQNFDRERGAQELSADILRRSQEAVSGTHR
jgi:hypothetical protein